MTYKPEIDGLRGIAVLFVLLCHMQLGMTGGFVGVDVFFVISGFLITSIVYNDIQQQKFSFLTFYGKRFVRLYPALIFVTLLTLIAGIMLCDVETLKNLARTARYTLLSLSNLYFNAHTGYFDLGADKQPFLHTWSLGVEWQFYLVWPLILWGLFKISTKPHVVVATLLVIITASVLGSQWALNHAPDAAYYQMHFRAFELAIGALLVFVYKHQLSITMAIFSMLVGLALIFYTAFTYTPSTPFPGFAALLPCLGTALCMFAGKSIERGNLLRHHWLVFVGQASYSIYLIHWPLLFFYPYYFYRPLTLADKLILIASSIILGILIYLLIEKKVNWRRLQHKLKGCSVMLVSTLLIIGVASYVNKIGKGFPQRILHQELLDDAYTVWGGKGYLSNTVLGNPEGKTLAIVGGDSFAASLAFGLDHALEETQGNFMLIYEPGCLISEIEEDEQLQKVCQPTSSQIIQTVNEKKLPLILIQAWGLPSIQKQEGYTNPFAHKTGATYHQFLTVNLDDIHQKIEGKPLILVSNVPYRNFLRGDLECLSRPPLGLKGCLPQIQPYPYQESPVDEFNETLKDYAQTHSNVYYIETALAACPEGGICMPMMNAQLYHDNYHTSIYGSTKVAEYIYSEIKDKSLLNF